jgi:hypothetical protein
VNDDERLVKRGGLWRSRWAAIGAAVGSLPEDWWDIVIQRHSLVASPYPDDVSVVSVEVNDEAVR